jgi:diaminopimelate decarboxylase
MPDQAKKPYVKPILTRQHAGLTGKFAPFAVSRYKDKIDGVEVRDLLARFGSPLFVYSYRTLKKKYDMAYQAFSTRYPKVQFAWSYKTNYLRAVCQAFHDLGSRAEVVSEFEYELARSLDIPGDRIVYNGPYKTRASLLRAASEGAMINIDGFDEIPELESVAVELGRPVEFGVRVNMTIPGHASWDRFGLSLDSGEALHAVRRAIAGKKLSLVGIHAHLGTFILEPQVYREAVLKMVELAKALKKEFGIRLRYLDVGGGFASKSKLKGSYLPTDQLAPDLDKYAEAICPPILEGFDQKELPLLMLETGRALVDEAGSLIATVVATKKSPSGIRSLVLDAGVNLLFTSFWYDFDIVPASDKGAFSEVHNVYGPLCMQIDVVGENLRLPSLEKGESVVIHPVGAYNNTQWMQFIQLRPRVVMIRENGDVEVIRDAETLDDVMRLDKVPSWLGRKD